MTPVPKDQTWLRRCQLIREYIEEQDGIELRLEFWRHVKIQDQDECWPWGDNKIGYGIFWLGPIPALPQCGRFQISAPRVVLMLERRLPDGYYALHHCDNKPCCNPIHLRAGLHIENMQDKADRSGYRVIAYFAELEARAREHGVLRATEEMVP